jgi:hypothetical protein
MDHGWDGKNASWDGMGMGQKKASHGQLCVFL